MQVNNFRAQDKCLDVKPETIDPEIVIWLWNSSRLMRRSDNKPVQRSLNDIERQKITTIVPQLRFVRSYTYILRRQLLANRYGQSAGDLDIVWDRCGRPTISSPVNTENISISAARSSDVEVFACTNVNSLGIDLEFTNHSATRMQFVRSQFCAAEQCELTRSNNSRQGAIDLWLLKEAYGKSLGRGIDLDPRESCFTLDGPVPRMVKSSNSSADKLHWQFRLLEPRHDLRLAVAALSVTQSPVSIRVHWLDDSKFEVSNHRHLKYGHSAPPRITDRCYA